MESTASANTPQKVNDMSVKRYICSSGDMTEIEPGSRYDGYTKYTREEDYAALENKYTLLKETMDNIMSGVLRVKQESTAQD